MLRAALRHRQVLTNGMELHVVEAGPDDGPLVLLLHGFPDCWFGWEGQIDALVDRGLRLWIPDQRGYNLSEKPHGVAAYRLDRLAGDILGLMDVAGAQQAAIVGHDWGAMVAWWLGMTAPERVERLAILNVPHPDVFRRTLLRHIDQLRRSWYILLFQIPGLPERMFLRQGAALGVRALVESALPTTFSDADLARYREAWGQPGALTGMINWYRAIARYTPPKPSSPRLTMPTLLLWGMRDVALSATMARPSIEMCDHGRLVLFEDASHWVQRDAAEAVSTLLGDFLTSPLSDAAQ